MDTRYLRSLLSVIDTGSIAEAARTEGLTPAAVGQRIQALERQLGVLLMSRARHTARPTKACLNLVPRARHIVCEAARLAADIDPGGVRGTLRVGAISTALTGWMPSMLRTLTADAPGIRPMITPGTSRELYEAVATGSLDAALLVAPPFAVPKTLQAITLCEEPLVLVTPLHGPNHIDGDGEIAHARLQDLPYIRYDPQAWGGRHAAQWLDDHGLAPSVVCDLDALETIVMLVSDGVGVSLLPQWQGIARLAQGCRWTRLAVAHRQATENRLGNATSKSKARQPLTVSGTDEGEGRYARRIVLLQSSHPERPGMLTALAQALGIESTGLVSTNGNAR